MIQVKSERWTYLLLLMTVLCSLNAGVSALETGILPATKYKANITKPASFFGFKVGERHLLPELITFYLRQLSQESERITYQRMGATEEGRERGFLIITSSERLKKLNLQKIAPEVNTYSGDSLVSWLGFSVHGNEASGANAAVLLAYYLAASNDEIVTKLLKDSIVIIEPILNPDGLGRFAQHVLSRRNHVVSADPNHQEHIEPWPNGRTNHYWFDLNRDWLLLSQKETQQRMTWYHYWKPNVLADFHEMGSDSTYFFQPGVPSRNNPLIMKENVKLTAQLTAQHAAMFDQQGKLFFTKEVFDDYYFGKGSTYPDVTGGIGILFEQATVRGHRLKTQRGTYTLSDTIKNQFDAALTTLTAAFENKEALIAYRKKFIEESKKLAKDDRAHKAIIFGEQNDKNKTLSFVKFLKRHRIDVYHLAQAFEIKQMVFKPGFAYIVPMQQPQYLLLKALFETNEVFDDEVFYDVSAWNVAKAFGVNHSFLPSRRFESELLGKPVQDEDDASSPPLNKSTVGYLLDWEDSSGPNILAALLKQKIKVNFSTKEFVAKISGRSLSFSRGSLFVPARQQSYAEDALVEQLRGLTTTLNPWYSVESGLTLGGADLGSPSIKPIKAPRVAMLVGEGVDAYSAGAIWFYVDKKLEYPLTLLPLESIEPQVLTAYSHIIMPGGDYENLLESEQKFLIDWLKVGGNLLTVGDAARWLTAFDDTKIEISELRKSLDHSDLPFAEKQRFEAKNLIGGAIMKVNVDTTHPLGFGVKPNTFSLKQGSTFFKVPVEPFLTVASYPAEPLESGYISKSNLEYVAKTAMLLAIPYQQGRIVVFADHPFFRGYWYGTGRFLANAIFFSANY